MCEILSSAFSEFIEIMICHFSFNYLVSFGHYFMVVTYNDLFWNIKRTLYPSNKSHLVITYYSFYILLNSIS